MNGAERLGQKLAESPSLYVNGGLYSARIRAQPIYKELGTVAIVPQEARPDRDPLDADVKFEKDTSLFW